MSELLRNTEAWSRWCAANPGLLDYVTSVDLGSRGSAYGVHLSLWGNPDQAVIDRFAASLGVESNPGWDPAGAPETHQWVLDVDRDGSWWHVTATSSDPAARTGFGSTRAAIEAAAS